MSDQQAFFDLLDIMETEKLVEPKRFFALMRGTFNIANILYLDADLSAAGLKVRKLHHTFSAALVSAYRGQPFMRLDPVLNSILSGGIRPIDWTKARRQAPDSEPLFAAAERLGTSVEGVTLPLAAPGGRIAFLAIQTDIDAAEWPAYRRLHLRDFQLLASLFHASLIEDAKGIAASQSGPVDLLLTQRETEVLGWAAAGKSYWEIGAILGISERTVRFFMTNARRKLNVVSNAQAVAKAVRRDLIPTF